MRDGLQRKSVAQTVLKETDNGYKLKYTPTEVEGECIILEIAPVEFNSLKFVLFVISNVFCFIPLLLTIWYPWTKRYFYYDFCSLEDCTDFWILNYDEEVTIVSKVIKTVNVSELQQTNYISFVNRYMTYIVDEGVVRVCLFDYKQRAMRVMNTKSEGLTSDQVEGLRDTFGEGTMVIDSPSCPKLFMREIVRPLYLFLLFSVLLWIFAEQYYYYAGTLIVISAVGLIINLHQMIKVNSEIFALAYYETVVDVLRGGVVAQLSSLDVVPGDIVFLKKNIKIPFQGVILQGSALINECSLTGQSVPIVKKADTFANIMDPLHTIDKNSLIFQGTTIVQVNYKKKMNQFEEYRETYGIPTLVIRTNFITTKGQLIRIILFPKEQENIFQRQSSKFLLFLFVLACASYGILLSFIAQYIELQDGIVKFLDIIAITVPPSLPVSMTFGIIYAIEKLRSKEIFCISQNKVITGGMIEFACFDKTGTLTEVFMDFFCLVTAFSGKFTKELLNSGENTQVVIAEAKNSSVMRATLTNMAANHSIIKIEETGELIGDPMEIKLFQFGDFELNQSNSDPEVIFSFESKRGHRGDVFRRFEFDSDVQRMSVVATSSLDPGYQVYSKGSPEMMLSIMNPATVPKNYNEVLRSYASCGFRVLTMASRKLTGDIKTSTREKIESDLEFNGFEVFQNKLKPETKGAIGQLLAAEIKCLMITGDNSLTGSNISYECGISDKQKKMIICDYKNDSFVCENFNYISRGKEDNLSVQNIEIEQINVEEKVETIEMKEMASSLKVFPEQKVTFMERMIQKAVESNSQLCVTGKAFNELFPGQIKDLNELQRNFLSHVTVFARTKPNDKAKVVMVYQHMDLSVSMCGDGANDCGALKQADIGLSLSQAEASISAPFTSKIANISSMVELIKECRAGLATNFSLFNIMATYALIQYTSTLVTQKFLGYPSAFEYLYWDLILNFCLILFIGNCGTAESLSISKPRKSLFCLTNLSQIIIMFGLQMLGQIMVVVAYSSAFDGDGFYSANGGLSNAINNYNLSQDFATDSPEVNAIFYFANPVYTIASLAFNIASPWRKPFYTNLPLMIVVIVSLFYSTLMLLYPAATWDQFQITMMPNESFRGYICGISYAFGIFLYFNQKLILEPISNWLVNKYPNSKWL